MAALGQQHRVGGLFAPPGAADVAVRRAVDTHRRDVIDGDDLSQLARIDDLPNLGEVGVVAQHVADAYQHTPFAGAARDGAAFVEPLCDRLFEQHVESGVDRLHAGIEVDVVRRGDEHGVGVGRSGEECVVVGVAAFGRKPEPLGRFVAPQFVAVDDGHRLQPFGVPPCVFQVFVGPVARADDRHAQRTPFGDFLEIHGSEFVFAAVSCVRQPVFGCAAFAGRERSFRYRPETRCLRPVGCSSRERVPPRSSISRSVSSRRET